MNKHLYIIDDDESVRNVFGRELKPWARKLGLTIKSFGDPREALNQLSADADSAWIVISDQCMPELDGLSMIKVIHELYPWIPQILVSGNIDADSVVAANPPGLFSVLEKPWDHEALLRMVDRAFQFREARA